MSENHGSFRVKLDLSSIVGIPSHDIHYLLIFTEDRLIGAKLGRSRRQTYFDGRPKEEDAASRQEKEDAARKLIELTPEEILKMDKENFEIAYFDIEKVEMIKIKNTLEIEGNITSMFVKLGLPPIVGVFRKKPRREFVFNIAPNQNFEKCKTIVLRVLQSKLVMCSNCSGDFGYRRAKRELEGKTICQQCYDLITECRQIEEYLDVAKGEKKKIDMKLQVFESHLIQLAAITNKKSHEFDKAKREFLNVAAKVMFDVRKCLENALKNYLAVAILGRWNRPEFLNVIATELMDFDKYYSSSLCIESVYMFVRTRVDKQHLMMLRGFIEDVINLRDPITRTLDPDFAFVEWSTKLKDWEAKPGLLYSTTIYYCTPQNLILESKRLNLSNELCTTCLRCVQSLGVE